jgi:hypothetical protein
MNYQNLAELAKNSPNIKIEISLGELIEANTFLVNETCRSLEQIIQDKAAETYTSPDKTAEIFDVDKSTLWRWRKNGYLVPIEVGGKRRYRMSDINKILKKEGL